MSFEDTPEVRQSMKMRGACDRVLCEIFDVESSAICRTDGDYYDQHLHIDLILSLPGGGQLTVQEHTLTHHYYYNRTLTMEYYQNRETKERGEFFNTKCQLLLHGYSNEDGTEFAEWYLFDLPKLIIWLSWMPEPWREKRLRPAAGSNAAFLWVKYSNIPEEAIIAKGKGPGETRFLWSNSPIKMTRPWWAACLAAQINLGAVIAQTNPARSNVEQPDIEPYRW